MERSKLQGGSSVKDDDLETLATAIDAMRFNRKALTIWRAQDVALKCQMGYIPGDSYVAYVPHEFSQLWKIVSKGIRTKTFRCSNRIIFLLGMANDTLRGKE